MFSGDGSRRGWSLVGLLAAGLLLWGAGGCGKTNPFNMAPVTGKITYEDGSPIPGTRMMVEFVPLVEAVDNIAAKPGKADVDMSDGTFTHVTTHKPNDGLIIGRHEVSAVVYDASSGSTQLEIINREIEITDQDNSLEIKVKKP